MIVYNSADNSYHDVPAPIIWRNPLRSEPMVDYSLEWSEDYRANGYYFEDTMPPADMYEATGETEDGRKIVGFVRTSSFDELTKKKQFVSSIKRFAEFRPLSAYSGWSANLVGTIKSSGKSNEMFRGFEWHEWGDYVGVRRSNLLTYTVNQAPITQSHVQVSGGIFVAKIKLKVIGESGSERDEYLFYPLKKINADIYSIYQRIGEKYDFSVGIQNILAHATMASTIISFNSTALSDECSLYDIVKNYCDAMGYGLEVEPTGEHWWSGVATMVATEFHTPVGGAPADSYMSPAVGEKCRLIKASNKVLRGQSNYVVIGGKKIYGTTINDPLLPAEATIAESECVVMGAHDEGLELYVSREGDSFLSAKPVSYWAIRSDLWPDKIVSYISSWEAELQTNHFDVRANRDRPFFQYENWIFSLKQVLRKNATYQLSGLLSTFPNVSEYSWPQLVLSQGMMTPYAYDEFMHYVPAGDRSYRLFWQALEEGHSDWVHDFEAEAGPDGYGREEGTILWDTPIGVGVMFRQRQMLKYYNYDRYNYVISGLEQDGAIVLAQFSATEISQNFTIYAGTTEEYELVEALSTPNNILLTHINQQYPPNSAYITLEGSGGDIEVDIEDFFIELLWTGAGGASRTRTYGGFPSPIKKIKISAHAQSDVKLQFITPAALR